MGSSVFVINSAVVFGVNIMRALLVLSALLALASCAPASSDDPTGKVLKYVITTTGTGSHCGMDTGHITLTLTSPIDEECKTNYLNSPANDFEQGETNIFTGECLGSCRSMAFPDGLPLCGHPHRWRRLVCGNSHPPLRRPVDRGVPYQPPQIAQPTLDYIE